MIKRILGKQSEQPKQQLTPAEVDGAELGNKTIGAFRDDMARVREAIEALTRRFGKWFATNSFFREISFAIATQTVIWLVVETLLLSSLERDFGKFCRTFQRPLEGCGIGKIEVKIIEGMNKLDELTCPNQRWCIDCCFSA